MSSRYLKNNDQVILNALPRFDISKGNHLKVALLIAGRSETSAYLVQELKKIDHINLLVIRTKQVTGESLKARYSRYKLYYSTLVRSIWSTGRIGTRETAGCHRGEPGGGHRDSGDSFEPGYLRADIESAWWQILRRACLHQ